MFVNFKEEGEGEAYTINCIMIYFWDFQGVTECQGGAEAPSLNPSHLSLDASLHTCA